MTETIGGATRERLSFSAVARVFFGLIRRNPVHFGVLTLAFGVLPAMLFGLLRVLGIVADPGDDPVAAFRGAPGETLVVSLASLFLQAGLMRASFDDMAGRTPDLGRSLLAGRQHFLPLLGINILVTLGVIVGLILLVIPGVYLSLRWFVAGPTQIAEKRGVFASMERSGKLTGYNMWVLLSLAVAGALLFLLAVLLLSLPTTLVDPLGVGGVIANLIVDPLATGAGTAMSVLGATSVYLELRRGHEGGIYGDEVSVFD